MNLRGLLAISGLPGLYRMVANRSNGLIVEPIQGGKRILATQRQHSFTPLETIAIYTEDGDSTPIKTVFERMMEQAEDNPVPSAKASKNVLREYFLDILPDHDQERVYPGDIKKVVKWYGILETQGALTAAEPAEEE